jgi:hypothetical protein
MSRTHQRTLVTLSKITTSLYKPRCMSARFRRPNPYFCQQAPCAEYDMTSRCSRYTCKLAVVRRCFVLGQFVLVDVSHCVVSTVPGPSACNPAATSPQRAMAHRMTPDRVAYGLECRLQNHNIREAVTYRKKRPARRGPTRASSRDSCPRALAADHPPPAVHVHQRLNTRLPFYRLTQVG